MLIVNCTWLFATWLEQIHWETGTRDWVTLLHPPRLQFSWTQFELKFYKPANLGIISWTAALMPRIVLNQKSGAHSQIHTQHTYEIQYTISLLTVIGLKRNTATNHNIIATEIGQCQCTVIMLSSSQSRQRILVMVAGGLKPIPATTGWEAGCTLD